MFGHPSKLWTILLLLASPADVAAKKSKTISFVPRSATGFADFHPLAEENFSYTSSLKNKKVATNIIGSRGGASPLASKDEMIGAAVFVALDYIFRKTFAASNINFPSQLGGCCILFVLMILAQIAKPGSGDSIFRSLSPGSLLLAKGLPIFFVPGLAMLPLAPSMGSIFEVRQIFDFVNLYLFC